MNAVGSADLKAALFATESAMRAGNTSGAAANANGAVRSRPARTRPLPAAASSSAFGSLAGSNSGVAARAAADAQKLAEIDQHHTIEYAQAQLARKAELYERLVRSGVHGGGGGDDAEQREDTFNVDFERKGWQRQDENDRKKIQSEDGSSTSLLSNDVSSSLLFSSTLSTLPLVDSTSSTPPIRFDRKRAIIERREAIHDKERRKRAFLDQHRRSDYTSGLTG